MANRYPKYTNGVLVGHTRWPNEQGRPAIQHDDSALVDYEERIQEKMRTAAPTLFDDAILDELELLNPGAKGRVLSKRAITPGKSNKPRV